MRLLADALQALCEADGGDRLAFAGDGGRGGGDEDELAVWREVGIGEQIKLELGAVGSDGFVAVGSERELLRDFVDGQERRRHDGP